MKLAVIGTGNMGKALLGGFIRGGAVKASEAYCFDVRLEAMDAVAEELGCNTSGSVQTCVKDADYVLMAVKPQHFDPALTDVSECLKDGAIVLSIAAAVTCDRISGILGAGRKFVRIMPNTPAQVGCGVSVKRSQRIEGGVLRVGFASLYLKGQDAQFVTFTEYLTQNNMTR